MPVKVVQFKHIGKVTFNKNRRSKNIKISVKPDKSVLVSYPFYVRIHEAADFVLKNEEWIYRQQQKQSSRRITFNENQEIETKLHLVTLLKGDSYSAKIKNKNAHITLVDFESDNTRNFIEKVLVEIYRIEAKEILPEKLNALANQFNFKYNKVSIRNNKRNWGSCSSRNNISLNLQMMKMPDHLINYILLHELVHTKIKNHSADFWDELNKLTNNKAKELAKEVKQYSTYTL